MKRLWKYFIFSMIFLLFLTGCGTAKIIETVEETQAVKRTQTEETTTAGATEIKEEGTYTSKEDVALYLHTYGKLPANFITKNEAKKLGWNSKEGNLQEVAPQKSIGGDKFSNREQQLPTAKGRHYKECDINYEGGYRAGERIIYSNDGLIYYTNDHYENFTLLYGEESNESD